MPETRPEEAFPRIDMIRQTIEQTEFAIPTSVTPIKATMSFGIAGRIGFDQTPSDIVHNADAALYYAKLKGRNGTYVYSDEGFVGLPDAEDRFSPTNRPPEGEIRSRQGYSFQPSPLRQAPIVNQIEEEEEEAVEPAPKPAAHPRWMVNGYILMVAVASLTLFVFAEKPSVRGEWWGLGLFAVMVVLTEWLSIDIYIRNTAVSTSAAPMLAGVLIYGPVGALVLSLTFASVAMIKYRSPISRFVFNFSNQLIAAMVYILLLQLAGVQYSSLDLFVQLMLCLAFMGLVYFITTSLVTVGMSLDFGQPWQVIWTDKFSWLAPYYLVMGLIAYALVFSFEYAGFLGTTVILVPLLLLRFAQVQYINRTRLMVNELKAKNIVLEKGAQEIQRLNEGLLDTLAEVVDLRDPDVLGHSKQVAQYAVMIARKLGLPPKQIELVRKAGLLHDIGKLGIAETILFKPDLLTPEEYSLVKQHVIMGANLLQACTSLAQLIPIIRHHHEYYNGLGYPDKLAGNMIPLEARIIAVADAIEAMASDRPYRIGMSHIEIMDELRRNSGTQFDPMVVNAFLEIAQIDGEAIIVNAARKGVLTQQIPAR
jgi:putative nucleotidyltransferase with HDIG domain